MGKRPRFTYRNLLIQTKIQNWYKKNLQSLRKTTPPVAVFAKTYFCFLNKLEYLVSGVPAPSGSTKISPKQSDLSSSRNERVVALLFYGYSEQITPTPNSCSTGQSPKGLPRKIRFRRAKLFSGILSRLTKRQTFVLNSPWFYHGTAK